jgi:hypothetical protein
MRRPFIIHRATEPGGYRRVTHRATGRELGRVGQHWDEGGSHHQMWSAFLPPSVDPDDQEGVGDTATRFWHAAASLLNPFAIEPEIWRKACAKHALRGPVEGCPDCETMAEAERRQRAESPACWAHYDWVCSLPEDEREWHWLEDEF